MGPERTGIVGHKSDKEVEEIANCIFILVNEFRY